MRTIYRTSLPKQIVYNGKTYLLNLDASYKANKADYSPPHSIRVKVLTHNLKSREDIHGKPYKPTVWIFTEAL